MKIDSRVVCDFCGSNDFLTDNDPPMDWNCAGDVDLCPACLEGIKRGVGAVKEGRVRPWEDVERELGLEEEANG